MVRVYNNNRDYHSTEVERSRITGLISRQPVQVSVKREVGNGITSAKVLTEIAAFTGRIDEFRTYDGRLQNEAYTAVVSKFILIALRENDDMDRESGESVLARRDDTVVTTDSNGLVRTFIVESVKVLTEHIEVQIDARS